MSGGAYSIGDLDANPAGTGPTSHAAMLGSFSDAGDTTEEGSLGSFWNEKKEVRNQ